MMVWHTIVFIDWIKFNQTFFVLEIVNIYTFPPNVTEDLIKISDWLITHDQDDFMNVLILSEKFHIFILLM